MFRSVCKSCGTFISGNPEGVVSVRTSLCKDCEDKAKVQQVLDQPEIKKELEHPMGYPQALQLLKYGCHVVRKMMLVVPFRDSGGMPVRWIQRTSMTPFKLETDMQEQWMPTYEDQFAEDWILVRGL